MGRQGRQAGFSPVEVLIVIAAVAVIGAAGWFVYQHNRTKATNAAGGTQTTNQTSNQQTTSTTPPAPTVTYLTIKEWGVRLPLSDSIKDAYYVVPDGISKDADGLPSGISLSVSSLDTACGKLNSGPTGQDNSLAGIIRVLPTDTDPVSGKLYTQLYPGGPTINGYYYAFSDLTSHRTCASQTTLQSIGSAFSAAAKSTALAPAN